MHFEVLSNNRVDYTVRAASNHATNGALESTGRVTQMSVVIG